MSKSWIHQKNKILHKKSSKIRRRRVRKVRIQIKIVCLKRRLKDFICSMFKHLALTGAQLFMSNKAQSFTKSKGVRMVATKRKSLNSLKKMLWRWKKEWLQTHLLSPKMGTNKKQKLIRELKTKKRKNTHTTKNIMMRNRMKKDLQKYRKKVRLKKNK